MPQFLSVYVVKHTDNISREVACKEAMEADAAIEALGMECVGGAYAQEGDAIDKAILLILGDD